MSFTFDAAQLSALLQDDSSARMLVSWGSYDFCTGDSEFSYGGTLYLPRGISFKDIDHGEMGMSTAIEVEDSTKSLGIANYASRFAGSVITWKLLLRGTSGGWQEIFEITWYIRYCQWVEGMFKLNIFGNTGFKKRAGLSVFSRYCDLKFKGVICGYSPSGPLTTCNGTFENCTARGRTTQFRGFRYAPESGDSWSIRGGASGTWGAPPDPGGGGPDHPWGGDATKPLLITDPGTQDPGRFIPMPKGGIGGAK